MEAPSVIRLISRFTGLGFDERRFSEPGLLGKCEATSKNAKHPMSFSSNSKDSAELLAEASPHLERFFDAYASLLTDLVHPAFHWNRRDHAKRPLNATEKIEFARREAARRAARRRRGEEEGSGGAEEARERRVVATARRRAGRRANAEPARARGRPVAEGGGPLSEGSSALAQFRCTARSRFGRRQSSARENVWSSNAWSTCVPAPWRNDGSATARRSARVRVTSSRTTATRTAGHRGCAN